MKRFKPKYKDDRYHLYLGKSEQVLKHMPSNSVHSIVCDPPYELGFMGKKWDNSGIAYSVELWKEALRVLKPGGHLIAFSGSRTYHRMTVAIEDAGFEIRDQIMWLYGSGFPKSLDVSKAIDKAVGATRRVVGVRKDFSAKANKERVGVSWTGAADGGFSNPDQVGVITAPATDAARQWSGWGTALKPAHEPICVARKPFKGTVAANVMANRTGALNIDECRVGKSKNVPASTSRNGQWFGANNNEKGDESGHNPNIGRWPANVIHDGSDDVLANFPTTKTDGGNAGRFFYCAKAAKKDRNEGEVNNVHPTVKPTDLMRYLIRLVTPPNGIVLDPFMGSGSTGKAAILEGFKFAGIDMTPEYVELSHARISHAKQKAVKPKSKLFPKGK